MNEHTKAVHDALLLYSTLAPNVTKAVDMHGTGFRSADRFFRYPEGMWKFHDSVGRMSWNVQCSLIASYLGPTKHARVLMALAWAMYDGWFMYQRLHRRSPVDNEAYWQAIVASDDLEETIKQEF